MQPEPTATPTSHQPLIASSVRQIVRQIPGRLSLFSIMTVDMIIFMTVAMITVKKRRRAFAGSAADHRPLTRQRDEALPGPRVRVRTELLI